MKKLFKRIIPLLLCIVLIILIAPARAKYEPSISIIRVGLDYGSGALPAAYLESVSGLGDGFNFGYYDENRQLVTIGSTSYTDVVAMRDVNMYESGGKYSTTRPSGSKFTVGCFHIQLDKEYESYSEAKQAAGTFTSVKAFVKYYYGKYYVCAGNYTSSTEASSAASKLSIRSDYSITSGSAYTVVLVRTSTGEILFEFDWGTEHYLGVEPFTKNGNKAQTWHAGYRYYGGFQFGRISGGDITVVNMVNVEDYIKGVIPYEISASWPIEAQKAQAVCARTFVMSNLNKHKSYGFDVCATANCQVYRGTGSATSVSDMAVDQTAGKYILYNGKLCECYYCSSDGGATENADNVWTADVPYLKGKIDPYEANITDTSGYYWSYTYTGDELASKLKSAGYSCSTIVNFYVSQYTASGNVYSMTFVDSDGKNITVTKASCRSMLGFKSQRFKIYNKSGDGTLIDTCPISDKIYVNDGAILDGDMSEYYGIGSSGTEKLGSDTLYAITGSGVTEKIESVGEPVPIKPVSSTFVVSGSGWGHNVGLSQWGAYSMAKYYDMSYEEILHFYFTDVTIE